MTRFIIITLFISLLTAAPDRPYHTTPDREKDMIHMSINIEVDIPEGASAVL